jgi:hypothetical protein
LFLHVWCALEAVAVTVVPPRSSWSFMERYQSVGQEWRRGPISNWHAGWTQVGPLGDIAVRSTAVGFFTRCTSLHSGWNLGEFGRDLWAALPPARPPPLLRGSRAPLMHAFFMCRMSLWELVLIRCVCLPVLVYHGAEWPGHVHCPRLGQGLPVGSGLPRAPSPSDGPSPCRQSQTRVPSSRPCDCSSRTVKVRGPSRLGVGPGRCALGYWPWALCACC